jgi:hypothetical protein
LVISSLIIAAALPGAVPLALGRVNELVPDDRDRQQAAWSFMTAVFARPGRRGLRFCVSTGRDRQRRVHGRNWCLAVRARQAYAHFG